MKHLFLFLLLAPFTLLHAAGSGGEAALYRCPMHPAVTSRAPGKCTICGMALVLSGSPAARPVAGVVALSPASIATIGVETVAVSRQPLTRTLRVTGRIEDDDTRHRILSAHVPGRIEKLHINFVGAPVPAGAPLATIYSPEMLSAQRIYIERLKAGEGAFPATERANARERLLELGLPPADLELVEREQKPSALIVIRAPEAGTVVAKSVYEGQYVRAADRLFEIADFSKMWFVFDLYEQDIPWVRPGQTVEISTRAVPDETISATVEFIDPNFDELTRTTKARAVLPNPHYSVGGQPHSLPHRVLAEGRVIVESPAVLAAPRSALLDRGTGALAYVDVGGQHYEQRTLKAGRRGDGLVEILSGLAEGERVVTHGALLIDAQAQLAHEALPPMAASHSAAEPSADLVALATAAVDASIALAADDYASYQKLFPALLSAAGKFPALPKLDAGTNLKSARTSFEPWSTRVADLLKPHRAALGVKIFQCPMTPVLGAGRWVQRTAPLKNPFFGATMADCGAEVP